MLQTLPVHGTPIHDISDISQMALSAMAIAQTGITPETTGGMHIHKSSNSLTFSPPYQANIQCFRICGCWKRHAKNVWGGDIKGCYWVCKAIPVGYWKQWKGYAGDGSVNIPDSFWQQHTLPAGYVPNKIFWVAPSSECCCTMPSSEAFTECPSADNAPCQETDDWQAMVPPKYGIGNLVWCIYEYSSGAWRALDAFDGLIQFKLKQPMKGCHTSARADLIGYKCKDEECSCAASLSPCDDPCLTEPSAWEGSCNQHVKARLRQVIRVYDPLGIVNVAFAKHNIELEMKSLIDCQLDCMMKTAVKLHASRTVGPWHHAMGSCGPTMGTREWHEEFCVNISNFTKIALSLFTSRFAQAMDKVGYKNRTAPAGTTGWAKWNPENRHFEVIA